MLRSIVNILQTNFKYTSGYCQIFNNIFILHPKIPIYRTEPHTTLMNRRNRQILAERTLQICRTGKYTISSTNKIIDISEEISSSISETQLISVNFQNPFSDSDCIPTPRYASTNLEITAETTLQACKRYTTNSACIPFVLNFASVKNPGGGFLRGSKAQEESLVRSSSLYLNLTSPNVNDYYKSNKKDNNSGLYNHTMIYSPNVVLFRDDEGILLAQPYKVNFITSPAVNAGVARRNDIDSKIIEKVMKERIGRILYLAYRENQKVLILGAFGCGVFRNDPELVGSIFRDLLFKKDGMFWNCFETVVFAIYDRNGACLQSFRNVFSETE